MINNLLIIVHTFPLRDTGCSLKELPGGMDDRDEWQERESKDSVTIGTT